MASAPLTLEHVHNQLKEWRLTKKTGESIPDNLWKDIIALAPHYVKSAILKTLGISTKQYNAKYQALTGKQPTKQEAAKTPAKSSSAKPNINKSNKAETTAAAKPKATTSNTKLQPASTPSAKAKSDKKKTNSKATPNASKKTAKDHKVVQISAEPDTAPGTSYKVEIRSTKENLVLTAYLPSNELAPFVHKLFKED